MGTPGNTTRERVLRELETTRCEFHALLGVLSEETWRAPSRNPAWTNGEVVFHMVLAFMLIPRLFSMIRFWSRLPSRYSRTFARMLDASTPVFDKVNAWGPRGGAKVFGYRRIGAKFDRVYGVILRRVASLGDDEWGRGMHYPRRWDPTFGEFMTFEDLLRFPTAHFEHHLRHLSVELPEGARAACEEEASGSGRVDSSGEAG